MKRSAAELSKLEGMPVLTVTTFQAVASKEAAAQQAQSQNQNSASSIPTPPPTTKSGLFGGLAGAIAKKAMQKKAIENTAPATPGRATIMTFTNEMLKLSTDVTDADVSIPAGFKEKN